MKRGRRPLRTADTATPRTGTAAVRTALSRLVEDERRTAIDKAIIEGYRRHPPEQPSAADLQRADRSISAEPW